MEQSHGCTWITPSEDRLPPSVKWVIEQFHRHLKGALKCHQPQDRWTDALPWVLLGIRSAVKDDSKCTGAEMVYDSPLRVPGEFASPHPYRDTITDSSTYAGQLRATMTSLSPIASRPLPSISTYLPTALGSCTHVFIRRDSVKKPLQSPYDGPFRVVRRTPKYYQLEMYGRHNTVSVDRLKPAHVDVTISRSQPAVGAPHSPPGSVTFDLYFSTDFITSGSSAYNIIIITFVACVFTLSTSSPPTSPSSATTPPVFTRSGRLVRFPQHLMD